MKTIKLIALAIALVFAAQVGAQNVGDNAPNFNLSKVDGGNFNLADYAGKVVFIFTFGNSCGHCIANGPNTQADIYNVYKDDANFVAVGVDVWDGSAGRVQSYRASTNITYPLLLNGSSMMSAYNTTYDRMIVIDQSGVIRYKGTTYATSGAVAQASDVIFDLLLTASVDEEQAPKAKFEAAYVSSQNTLRFNNPFATDGQVTYRVMDMSGRILQQNQVHLSERNTLYLDARYQGLNFISISDGKQSYTAKFIR